MMTILKHRWVGLLLTGIFLSFFILDAANASPLSQLNPMAENTRNNGQSIAYAVVGLAALGMGVMGFFGRFPWRWIFSWFGGLGMIAAVPLIIAFVTGFF